MGQVEWGDFLEEVLGKFEGQQVLRRVLEVRDRRKEFMSETGSS